MYSLVLWGLNTLQRFLSSTYWMHLRRNLERYDVDIFAPAEQLGLETSTVTNTLLSALQYSISFTRTKRVGPGVRV